MTKEKWYNAIHTFLQEKSLPQNSYFEEAYLWLNQTFLNFKTELLTICILFCCFIILVSFFYKKKSKKIERNILTKKKELNKENIIDLDYRKKDLIEEKNLKNQDYGNDLKNNSKTNDYISKDYLSKSLNHSKFDQIIDQEIIKNKKDKSIKKELEKKEKSFDELRKLYNEIEKINYQLKQDTCCCINKNLCIANKLKEKIVEKNEKLMDFNKKINQLDDYDLNLKNKKLNSSLSQKCQREVLNEKRVKNKINKIIKNDSLNVEVNNHSDLLMCLKKKTS